MMLLPGIYFGQYRHFLMSDAAKRPLFLNSTMAFNTQKTESNKNTLSVDQTGFVNRRSKPVVFPRSSNSFWTEICWLVFSFAKIHQQMMSLSAHPASWYSFLKGHGILGTNMIPGQLYSFTHLDMISSMQLIQLGEIFVVMFLFQQSNMIQFPPKMDEN